MCVFGAGSCVESNHDGDEQGDDEGRHHRRGTLFTELCVFQICAACANPSMLADLQFRGPAVMLNTVTDTLINSYVKLL